MPYLRLQNVRSGEKIEFEQAVVRVGRAPDLEMTLAGESSEVVSGTHARLSFQGGAWALEDGGSTNGTFLDERRLAPGRPVPIEVGSLIGFGQAGPRFLVEMAAERRLAPTLAEGQPAASPNDETVRMDGLPAFPDSTPAPLPPVSERKIRILLREDRTGAVVKGEGVRLRIGRGRECELRPVQEGDVTVSRVHAEIVLKPDGAVVLRDAHSRNGTFVNGEVVKTEYEIQEGDYIVLGNEGPRLVVAELAGGRETEPRAESPAASPSTDKAAAETGRMLAWRVHKAR